MEDKIFRQLKQLKAIEPNPLFVAGSRRTILALRKEEPVFAWLNLRMAGAMAGAVAMVAAAVFMFSGPSATTALASPEALNREFTGLNINVELKAIDYHQNVDQTVSLALSEISDNRVKHLNKNVLETESDNLNLNSSTSTSQVDDLLNKVIF
ncbi:MAG: hypothetical protein ABSE68_01595 [Minisyncoccia bacterium]